MIALRLSLIEQRVRRNEQFNMPLFKHGATERAFLQLTSIDALLGRTGIIIERHSK